MKPEQIHIVKETWAQVIPIADTAAELFYNRLFTIDPTTRTLFRGVDILRSTLQSIWRYRWMTSRRIL